MCLGENQGRSPRTTVQQPPVDAEILAEQFHIGKEVLGGVVGHIDRRIRRVRQALPAPSLIEQHDPEGVWIEAPSRAAPTSTAGPDVYHQHRPAFGTSAGFPVDLIAVTDVEQARLVGLDLGKPLPASAAATTGNSIGHRATAPKSVWISGRLLQRVG